MQKKGLVINFVKNTKRQYSKFLHVFRENEELPVVIVDDDVIYPIKSMEYLLKKHHEYPELVVANRAHKMSINNNGILEKYKLWEKEVCEEQPGVLIFPTGAGGVLYPKRFFESDLVCNEEIILKYAPYADDIWLKGCSLAKGIYAVCSDMIKNEAWYYRYTPLMTEGALHKTNVDCGFNDYQLKMTLDYLASMIKECCSDYYFEVGGD